MVEKIIINPNKVRGYGNIVSSKGASDFTEYYSNVTETTDTVNGATSKVFNMETTIIFYDTGITGLKNNNWYIRSSDTSDLTVTIDDEGTTLTNASTTTGRYYYANPEGSTSTTPPITMSDFIIECDIITAQGVSGTAPQLLLQGMSAVFNLKNYTSPYHLKLVKEGTTVKHYVDDTLKNTTTITNSSTYYTGFQLYKNCTMKFKNYMIYEV